MEAVGATNKCLSGLKGDIIPDLWDRDVTCKTGVVPHCKAFVREAYVQKPSMYITCYCQCQSILFLISTWLLCISFFFFLRFIFFSEGVFNISSIKAKRAVNRMHCVVQIVIGGLLKAPWGHQSDANSIPSHSSLFVISGSVISVSANLSHQTNPLKR